MEPPETTGPIAQSAKTAPLLHLFNRNRASTVAFENDVLTVWAKSGLIAHTIPADEIMEVKLRKLPLLAQLVVRTKQGRTITVGGLDRATSETLHTQLNDRVEELLNDEAARKAISLAPEIINLKDSVSASLTPDSYTRRLHTVNMTIGGLSTVALWLKHDEISDILR